MYKTKKIDHKVFGSGSGLGLGKAQETTRERGRSPFQKWGHLGLAKAENNISHSFLHSNHR